METKNAQLNFLEEKKMLILVIFFVVALFATLVGTYSPISYTEASETEKELKELAQHSTVSSIFGNNYMLCLFMFAPVIGPIFGIYVLYNTGWVIGAIAVSRGVDRALMFTSIFILPHAWLEYLAYSLAMTQSVWLLLKIFKGQFGKEVVPTAILIALDALILLAAAFVEIFLMILFGNVQSQLSFVFRFCLMPRISP
ncbi:MAG: stage II sporulation protein M [Candidatus Bathyarchaeia archaeon]